MFLICLGLKLGLVLGLMGISPAFGTANTGSHTAPTDAETTTTTKACLEHESPPEACTILGQHYEGGRGIQLDYGVAGQLYVDACLRGYGLACLRLGTLTLSGHDPDTQRAKRAARTQRALFARTGADTNVPLASRQQASLELAIGIHALPIPPSISPNERTMAFQKRACEQDDAEMCFVLGQGQRAQPTHYTLTDAKGFISKACVLGHQPGCVAMQTECFSAPGATDCPQATVDTAATTNLSAKGPYFLIERSFIPIRKQTRPELSETLSAFLHKVGEPECQIYVYMDSNGHPFRVDPTPQCHPMLQESAVNCALQWTWKVPKVLRDKNKSIRIASRVVFYQD